MPDDDLNQMAFSMPDLSTIGYNIGCDQQSCLIIHWDFKWFSSDWRMFDDPWSHPVILALIGRCLIILESSSDFSSDWQMFDDPWSHPVILALIGRCLMIWFAKWSYFLALIGTCLHDDPLSHRPVITIFNSDWQMISMQFKLVQCSEFRLLINCWVFSWLFVLIGYQRNLLIVLIGRCLITTVGLPMVFISGWQRRILRELKQRED
jgi:hypothetical protein